MSTVKKGAFSLLKLLFMVVLLTFISPFILDFSADSLDDLFLGVYQNADTSAHAQWGNFIDTKLCTHNSQTTPTFERELADFCSRDKQSEICESPKIYEFQDQICQVFTQSDFGEYCDTVQAESAQIELDNLCQSYRSNTLSQEDFFVTFIQRDLGMIEDDVFEHETVYDSALETLQVPKILRFETYLVWQRILLILALLTGMYFLAGNVRTLTHKIGHTLVQTGGFLIIYRLVIMILIATVGIDTSLFFENFILGEGASFADTFQQTFLSLFLLMNTIFFMPTYWLVSILVVVAGFLFYIPWVIRKVKNLEDEKEEV